MKHFLSVKDFSKAEILSILETATELKKKTKNNTFENQLANKSMAMIFEQPSLRTRLSFEIGMTQLGGHAVYLAPADIGLGTRESVHDTSIVASSMADIIIGRVTKHENIVELAKHSSVPVINAMTNLEHPCQIMADLLTIYEHFGELKGPIAYFGDGDNNVTNSWAYAAQILGIEFRVCSPAGYEISPEIVTENKTKLYSDAQEAAAGAMVVMSDTWVSMGKEAESSNRITDLAPVQVTKELMQEADTNAIFMHCLPAYRGKEMTAEVIDGPQSVVWQQAENRLHVQKAIILHLL